MSQKIEDTNTSIPKYPKYLYNKFQLYNGTRKFIDFNSLVQNYTTLYTLYSNHFTSKINSNSTLKEKKKLVYKNILIQITPFLFIGILPHEEGHRSILTHLNIGSISDFTYNYVTGIGAVSGVLDETLKELRDTRIADYIHLHTAGIETDYSIARKYRKNMSFSNQLETSLSSDYILHNMVAWLYLASAFSSSVFGDQSISYRMNPRENDIVGHDVYGAIKNLYRPTDANFVRYNYYSNLTGQEKDFAKRVASFSLINALDLLNYFYRDKIHLDNIFTGYILTPFGHQFELSFFNKLLGYTSQSFFLYANNSKVGYGAELNFEQIKVGNFLLGSSFSFWNQPKNLDFRTTDFDLGYGFQTNISYPILNHKGKEYYFNLGLKYKTDGFQMAEESLQDIARVSLSFMW